MKACHHRCGTSSQAACTAGSARSAQQKCALQHSTFAFPFPNRPSFNRRVRQERHRFTATSTQCGGGPDCHQRSASYPHAGGRSAGQPTAAVHLCKHTHLQHSSASAATGDEAGAASWPRTSGPAAADASCWRRAASDAPEPYDATEGPADKKRKLPRPTEHMECPRCGSNQTKFCAPCSCLTVLSLQ